MVAAADEAHEVWHDQADEADDADRRDRQCGGQRRGRKYQVTKAPYRQADDRRLQLAA